MTHRALALLLVGVMSAAQISAQDAAPTPSDEVIAQEWRARLEDEQAALTTARERVANAEHALGDSRQRRRPRGKQLRKLQEELAEAREELAELEAQWPALLEEARRAGATPAVLREFE